MHYIFGLSIHLPVPFLWTRYLVIVTPEYFTDLSAHFITNWCSRMIIVCTTQKKIRLTWHSPTAHVFCSLLEYFFTSLELTDDIMVQLPCSKRAWTDVFLSSLFFRWPSVRTTRPCQTPPSKPYADSSQSLAPRSTGTRSSATRSAKKCRTLRGQRLLGLRQTDLGDADARAKCVA